MDPSLVDWSRAMGSYRWNRGGPCSVTSGVPQGTVLGPLLFLIFINDIAQDMIPSICLFADDALLYHSIQSHDNHIRMQEDTLAHWASTWCMEFNVTKCYTMHIVTTSQIKQAVCIPYSMSGKELEHIQNTKYLGVTIYEHLSWEPHISATIAKAQRQLAFLDRNLRSCSQSQRETAYKTIMRPAIELRPYGTQGANPWILWILDHLPQLDYDYASVIQLIKDLGCPVLWPGVGMQGAASCSNFWTTL